MKGPRNRCRQVTRSSLALIACCGLLLAGCRGRAPVSAQVPSPFSFTDVTARAGIHFRHNAGATGRKYLPETMGAGCAFIDYNNDGWLDVLLLNGMPWPDDQHSGFRAPGLPAASTPALYRNNRDGTFTEVTAGSGLDVPLYAMGCCIGDYDNDGHDDIYITTAIGPNRLFHNTGKDTFEDRTHPAGVGSLRWGTSCAWLDYDHDGWLDLFVCNYVRWTPQTDKWCGFREKAYCRPHEYPGDSCILYHNNHDGTFTDVSQQAGFASTIGKALGVVVLDFDRDGWEDLAVANDTEPTFLFRNNHDGTFREVALEQGLALSDEGLARAGMGIDAAQPANDGRWALLIGNFVDEGLAFFRQQPSGDFSDAAREAQLRGPSLPRVTFAVGFVDFDNDGRPDAFAVNGHIDDDLSSGPHAVGYAQKMLFFHNEGGGRFRDVSEQAGAAAQKRIIGRGAAWGDFDNDGDLDLLVTSNQGPPLLLRNDPPKRNHALAFKLIGRRSNRSAIGARIDLECNGAKRTEYVRSGGSYLSASDRRVVVGLGAATRAHNVTITWNHGSQQRLGSLDADRVVEVLEEGVPSSR